jgi:hypothetical protein
VLRKDACVVDNDIRQKAGAAVVPDICQWRYAHRALMDRKVANAVQQRAFDIILAAGFADAGAVVAPGVRIAVVICLAVTACMIALAVAFAAIVICCTRYFKVATAFSAAASFIR